MWAAEVVLCLIMSAATGILAWNLGVRRERGRQARYEEVSREIKAKRVRRGGVTLTRIKIRR